MFSRHDNLVQFREIVTRAYEEAKRLGRIPDRMVRKVDKRLALGPVHIIERNGRCEKIMVDRIWRRRVARMYARVTRQDDTGGKWYQNIDWEAIYNWILENIVPITRILVMLIPMVL